MTVGDVSTTTQGAPDCPPPDETIPGHDGLLEYEVPDVYHQDDAGPGARGRAQSALDCMTEQGMEVLQFEEHEGLYGTELTSIIGWGSLPEPDARRVSSNREGRDRAWAEQDCMAECGATDDVGDTLDELREVSPSEEATLDCQARAEDQPPPPTDRPRPPAG